MIIRVFPAGQIGFTHVSHGPHGMSLKSRTETRTEMRVVRIGEILPVLDSHRAHTTPLYHTQGLEENQNPPTIVVQPVYPNAAGVATPTPPTMTGCADSSGPSRDIHYYTPPTIPFSHLLILIFFNTRLRITLAWPVISIPSIVSRLSSQ